MSRILAHAVTTRAAELRRRGRTLKQAMRFAWFEYKSGRWARELEMQQAKADAKARGMSPLDAAFAQIEAMGKSWERDRPAMRAAAGHARQLEMSDARRN